LVEPYLKTKRAKTHLDALRNELALFKGREPKPYSFFRKENLQTGKYEVRIKMEDTPLDIPLILGDLLYCLRSALDQTVWQLAKLRRPYPEGTQFPILDKWNGKTRKSFLSCTDGVPAGAIGIIKSLQPYHRADPTAHLLWRLNRLCNIDKHRRIPVHGDRLMFYFAEMTSELAGFIELDHEHHMFSAPLSLKSKMGFDPEISFDVIFGDMSAGVSSDFDGITKIYEFVADNVIPRFARFFPK
jgi:hypothetical protein